MSVIFVTSKGDFTIDLFWEKCPNSCFNFLSLCKVKYYNNCLFFNIQRDYIVQCGDPTNTGEGGNNIYDQIGKSEELNKDEFHPLLKHKFGSVSLANRGISNSANSQFFIVTSSTPLSSLDKNYTVIGEISEGIEVIQTINNAPVQKGTHNPYQAIRIKHSFVLDHPLESMEPFKSICPYINKMIPEKSPEPKTNFPGLIDEDENLDGFFEKKGKNQKSESVEDHVAKSRSRILEMVGDLPKYDMTPPKNVLFVCKLNPVTKDEDLEIIFSRFGTVKSCEIIRDKENGNSLCYGFVGFDNGDECELAYLNMQSCVIDDRLVRVDFSQSVAKLWRKYFQECQKSGKSEIKKISETKQIQSRRDENERKKTNEGYDKEYYRNKRKRRYDEDDQEYRRPEKKRKVDHERRHYRERDSRRNQERYRYRDARGRDRY